MSRRQYSAISGIVESSTNVGVITLYVDKIEVIHELRGGFATTKYYIYEKIKMLMKLLGGTAEGFDDYPHWQYLPNSALRDMATDVFEREFHRPLKTIVVHAGIEVGAILANMPHLDAISIGPNCYDIHSPRERVSVSSTERTYRFLLVILSNMKN